MKFQLKFLSVITAIIIANIPAIAQQKKLQLTDWLTGKFWQYSVYGICPMNNGESYTVLENNSVVRYSYSTGNLEQVMADFNKMSIPNVEGYEISNDESKILFHTEETPIYRRSFLSKYYIANLSNGTVDELCDGNNQQMATLSPDGTKVAYISNNNIILKDLSTGTFTNVTTDGKFNHIINGIPDWVYEEEFGFNKAYEFSPDNRYLAYIKFDESQVKSYTLQYYHYDANTYISDNNYPTPYEYKYPKAGEANSIVSVHIYDISTGRTITANIGDDTDIYIPHIQWTARNGELAISRLNRLQNRLDILQCDAATGKTKQMFRLDDKRYIEEDVVQSVRYMSDGKSFIITTEEDGFRNIRHYNINGKKINDVTSGSHEVISLIGYNDKTQQVYFTAVGNTTTREDVCVANLNGKNRRTISNRQGCNSAEFSANYKYFIQFNSDCNNPKYVSICDANGKELRVLEDNEKLRKTIEKLGGSRKELFTWINPTGDTLNGYMIKPLNFDSTRHYPVLVVGYNGPNYNMVNDEFTFNWQQIISQDSIIVACTDTRGTGRKGTEFRKCTYGQLGNLETRDLTAFAKYLSSLPYVNGNRLGIWGWSYGGFMVANVMTRGAGSYKVGVSIAPVTNWEFYDNIYTERYMGLPSKNVSGYKDNSPIKYAEQLEGKLLLIFGSADDNVHPQNAMIFCEALVQANKQFDMMQYTNKNHGIYGGNTSLHLYTKVINYILDNL